MKLYKLRIANFKVQQIKQVPPSTRAHRGDLCTSVWITACSCPEDLLVTKAYSGTEKPRDAD